MTGVVYAEVAPSPALAGVVRCYWSIEGVAGPDRTVTNRVLPDGCMDVIFDLGDEPAVSAARWPERACVVGTMRRAIVVGMRGRVDMVGIRFRPGAAVAYLALPAIELTDRMTGLSDFRSEAGLLTELVAEVAGPAVACDGAGITSAAAGRMARARLRARAAELDRALVADHVREPDLLVTHAVRMIEASGGVVAISEIERRLGVSPRTLTRRFTAAVGVGPKTVCRVARLQAAAGAIRQAPTTSLARIAARTGFHDQPHLNRDFIDLAGITPAAYAREAGDGFIQDDDATAH